MTTTDLDTLTDAVLTDLNDASNGVWSDAQIQRAIKRALRDYSVKCPYRTDEVIEISTAGREQDLSDLDGLCGVEAVWYPYDSDDVDLLPRYVRFEMRLGASLFVLGPTSPQVDEEMRVYYWTMQTLVGLDGATATTLPAEDWDLVALGAAAYAALEASRGAIGVINVSGYTPLHWRDWGRQRLLEFEAGVAAAMSRQASAASGVAVME